VRRCRWETAILSFAAALQFSDSWFRSALLAGLILNQLGMSGCQAVERLRVRRPGALLNECVASYLLSM
jgi:hypothetical protein